MSVERTENRRNKKKTGYSLIEALVALGILLLGIVPVVTVATQAMLFHHRASETEEAARISQTMIDYIKSRGYDNLDPLGGTKYSLSSTSGGAFTVDGFGSSFGISQDLVLLNSKGINLNEASFYVVMDKDKNIAKLKKSDGSDDTYTDPVTGETPAGPKDMYREDLIYGKFIFGFGDTDTAKKTGREKEMETTFIITPIENWK
ncbi:MULTISPECIES: type IV pilus modification PilV family protein [Psychrilyobacter]|nr:MULTISPECIES: prepilin-type N-terminal cleavage/methylation domain-containing protein [Psychrilyobacter]MCS5420344.1 prepilin-type N-terminal cleavage/methylation domain-containing protein [Psychrilyobacter sp. S5]NDI78074.1 hypothetical protein [Psychrilyobacter piezotolerans]